MSFFKTNIQFRFIKKKNYSKSSLYTKAQILNPFIKILKHVLLISQTRWAKSKTCSFLYYEVIFQ